MTNSIILHHYDASPYAEKIRLMFGLTQTRWQSLLSPAWPPRPNVDPLSGGYRRIPIAQIGADIFCDTALIAQEVAQLTRHASLDPSTIEGESRSLMKQAEREAFFAAITAVPPLRLLGTMLKEFGPTGAYRFVKDRTGLMKGGTVRPPNASKAKHALTTLLDGLEARLASGPWVGGERPSFADFACYHPLWLHVSCNRRPLHAGPKVLRWYQGIANLGHGTREEITQADAFHAARKSAPRPLPPSTASLDVTPGDRVSVSPVDYGVIPVTGTLAAITEQRIIVSRETDAFGTLHVHFPRNGYALKAA